MISPWIPVWILIGPGIGILVLNVIFAGSSRY